MKLSPGCSAGTSLKLAVSGSFGGPDTVADGLLLSGRGSFPRVHTAPLAPQARPPESVTVTASRESGSTVTSHRSRLPLTRRALVTSPSVTVKDSSRKVVFPIPMSSLNATWKLNALAPSCAAGTPLNSAVSGSGSGVSVFRIVPVASASAIVAPEALLSVSVNVSPPSSSESLMIGTLIVFVVSPLPKVSVPLVLV